MRRSAQTGSPLAGAKRSASFTPLLALVSFAFGLAATPATGGGSTALDACQKISASGSYVLAGNLSLPAAGQAAGSSSSQSACLNIAAPDVTIDLNGFAMRASGQGVGIAASAPNVTIMNGMLTGFSAGIQAPAGAVRLDGLVVANSGAGAQVGDNSIVRYSRFLGNHGDGLDIQSGIVIGCVATGNQVGFNISGAANLLFNTALGNTAGNLVTAGPCVNGANGPCNELANEAP